MSDLQALLADPSARLVTAYREIHRTHMRGLPFVNPALEVEAVAFAPWCDRWLGILVTPWCMNLMLVPREAEHWTRVRRGGKRTYVFPAGRYEFVGGEHAVIGEYQSCSLFSPVLQFVDQDSARLVARLARDALMDGSNDDGSDDGLPATSSSRRIATLASLETPVSRRDLLRGRLVDRDRDQANTDEPRG